MSTLTRILLFGAIVGLAVMTGRATDPQPTPTAAVAARTIEAPAPAPTPYTCTSASSCAVLAAALNGPSAQPPAPRSTHRQPRAHSTQRRSSGPSQGEVTYHGPTQCFEDGNCRHDGDRMLSPRQVTGIIAGMCQQQGPSGPACRVLATR